MMTLAGKKIVLGVSGGIAAYKTPELVRRLRERGAEVRVAMTEAAKAFITPLSLQAVSGYPVSDSLLDPAAQRGRRLAHQRGVTRTTEASALALPSRTETSMRPGGPITSIMRRWCCWVPRISRGA